MDIITQLQDQVNKIAFLAFNSVGSLQRDAAPVRLSQNYPDPQALAPGAPPLPGQQQQQQQQAQQSQQPQQQQEQAPEMASTLVQAAKQFDALVAALPIAEGGEEAQLKRIAELQQAENEEIGKELQLELDLAEEELKLMRELFHTAADDCLRFKQLQ
ncbi:hypothetical protein SELMODRAFT_111729 [Selaginella moellendorffii]|uniref:Mediator of RNA polymerase II transcription subunit 21 n=1 Tax=Selaginella moellendorffii TaxID=88036 RepID=D8S9W6_SELML|nr:hypothetical protein SELMODRAFT_136226 [Selaginella moellendorffii]EFJ18896.1 hypothetical protein SELMODRAFT_111729 [Selaginella moellendorffii]